MNLPNWPGAAVCYKRLNDFLGIIAAEAYQKQKAEALKKRKVFKTWCPTEGMQEIIHALDKGDENEIKHLIWKYDVLQKLSDEKVKEKAP